MRKKKTEVTFILDRSGSMQGLEKDTIGGYNGFIEKQLRERDGECTITTYLFSNHYKIIEEDTPLEMCKELNEDIYYVGGCTALFDTVGTAIEDSNHRKRSVKQDIGRIFVIITDGLENASSDYSLRQVRDLVKNAEEDGAEFFFLGADIDAFEGARSLGISSKKAAGFTHNSRGIKNCFRCMNKTVKTYRKEGTIPEDWAKDLD